MKEFIIGKNDSGQRVDKFVEKVTEGLPRSLLYKAIRKKDIKRNGKRCEANEFLVEGDQLRLYLPEEFFLEKKILQIPKKSPLEILYEDENIIIVDKPAGLLSHSDEAGEQDTAIGRIQNDLINRGEYDPSIEKSFSPALISRLDRNTGGLIAAAKNAFALRELSKMMREHQIHKKYIAVVEGEISKQGDLIGYLSKDTESNKVRMGDKGKKVSCRYRLLKSAKSSFGMISIVEVELITGRSHQIRAQFANIGHPLIGDLKYGGQKYKNHRGQLLYATTLSFSPPLESELYYLQNVRIEKKPLWIKDFPEI